MKIVGQIYKKNNHAGLAYQLITFPSFVRIKAINVQEDMDAKHERKITPIHIMTYFAYIDVLTSIFDNKSIEFIQRYRSIVKIRLKYNN